MTVETFSPEIWTGRWRWLPDEACYADPARQIKAQTADVRVTGLDFRINQAFEHHDGLKMSWTWEGAFDGVPRPIRWDHNGSEMTDIAFYFIRDGLGGDTYTTRDGSKFGSEVYRLQPGRLDVWGCYTLPGNLQYPYREAWERIG